MHYVFLGGINKMSNEKLCFKNRTQAATRRKKNTIFLNDNACLYCKWNYKLWMMFHEPQTFSFSWENHFSPRRNQGCTDIQDFFFPHTKNGLSRRKGKIDTAKVKSLLDIFSVEISHRAVFQLPRVLASPLPPPGRHCLTHWTLLC